MTIIKVKQINDNDPNELFVYLLKLLIYLPNLSTPWLLILQSISSRYCIG